MQALWITLSAIGGLLLLCIAAIFFGSVKLRITCLEKPKITASFLGIRVTLLSDKKERPATKDLSTCHNPNRALKKELARQRKEAERARRKREKIAKRKAMHKAEKQMTEQATPNILENLEMIRSLLKKLYKKTRGKIKIRIQKLLISIGTEDAAKTALTYGIVLQSTAILLQWIQDNFTELHRKPGSVQIQADYLSGKSHAEIDMICSVRVFRALKIAYGMLTAYKAEKSKAIKKAKKRQAKKQAAQTIV